MGRGPRSRAERVAAALAARGVAPGDRVAIVLRTEPAFLDAFFGAWLAGAVPVPLYPPVRLGRMDEYVAADRPGCSRSPARGSSSPRARCAGCSARAVARAGRALGCVDVAELAARDAPARPHAARRRTSRSSSSRRAPPWTRSRWRSPTRALAGAGRRDRSPRSSPDARDALVSWLPLYHDMGLIGCLLAAMSYPGPARAPRARALPRAARALAARRSRATAGTISVGAELRLRVLRRARARTRSSPGSRSRAGASRSTAPSRSPPTRCAASPARFAPHGLDPGALVPVYGLSEAALAVTFGAPRAAARRPRAVDPVRLARDGRRRPGDARDRRRSARPSPGVEVEVRADDGAPAGEGRLGRDLRARPVAHGGLPRRRGRDARARSWTGWLDTGDLGFVAGRRAVRARPREGRRDRARREPRARGVRGGARRRSPGCGRAARSRSGFTPDGGEGEALAILAERARARRGARRTARGGERRRGVRRAVLERTGRRAAHGAPPRARHAAAHLVGQAPAPARRCGASSRARSRRRARVTPLRLALELARGQLAYARAAPAAAGMSGPIRDAVVVGGGPAGLAFAIAAARRGLAVTVLERRAAPVDKACGEGILPAGVRALDGARGAGAASTAEHAAPIREIRWIERRRRGAAAAPRARRARRAAHGALGGARRARAGGSASSSCSAEVHAHRRERDRDLGAARPRATFARAACSSRPTGSARRCGAARGSTLRRAAARRRFGLRRHFAIPPWADAVEVHFGRRRRRRTSRPSARGGSASRSSSSGSAGPSSSRRCSRASPRSRELLAARAPTRDAARRGAARARGARARIADRLVLLGDAAGYLDAVTGEGLSLAFGCALDLAALLPRALARGADARGARALRAAVAAPLRAVLGVDAARPGLTRRPALRRRLLALAASRPSRSSARSGSRWGEAARSPPRRSTRSGYVLRPADPAVRGRRDPRRTIRRKEAHHALHRPRRRFLGDRARLAPRVEGLHRHGVGQGPRRPRGHREAPPQRAVPPGRAARLRRCTPRPTSPARSRARSSSSSRCRRTPCARSRSRRSGTCTPARRSSASRRASSSTRS